MMEFHVAWTTLGADPLKVTALMQQKPLNLKIETLDGLTAKAKSLAKNLMASSHPDRGGNIETFKRVNEAVKAIEGYNEMAKAHFKKVIEKREEELSKRVIIEVDQ